MPQLRFELKIKILRILLGIFIFGWMVDISFESKLFFTKALFEKSFSGLSQFYSENLVFIFLFLIFIINLFFIFGLYLRITGALLGLALISLFQINPMLYSPALPFEIWLVFAISLVGPRQNVSDSTKRILYHGAWILLAGGYFFAGLDKLIHSESWRDGSALGFILSGPLARWPQINVDFELLPKLVQKFFTWTVPTLEILFMPLSLFRNTRALSWWILVVLHIFILALLWLPSVSIGMLLFHFFLIDSSENSKSRG